MEAMSVIKLRFFLPMLAAVPSLLALPLPARADTIELITGEVIEGKILGETRESVIIKTRFSENIMEDRPVPRDQIKTITRAGPDEHAFSALQNVQSPATAFTAGEYEAVLGPFREFLENFGYSSRVQTVREMMRELEAEQSRIAGGEVKIHGRIVNPAEMGEEAVEIEKHRKVAQISQMAQRGDIVRAVNEFFAFAKDHSGAAAFVDAVEQARRHLTSLIGLLDHQMRNNPILERRRGENLALASPADRASMEAARATQIEELENAATRSREAGDVIPPFATFSMPSMQAAHTAATQELQKLNGLDLESMRRSVRLLSQAVAFLEEREMQASQQHLQQSLEAWPGNAAAQRFQVLLKQEIERRNAADEPQPPEVAGEFTPPGADADSNPTGAPEETTD